MLTDILNQLPPEEYDRIVEWPEDDTHLRDRCWKSPRVKVTYGWRDGGWKAWNAARRSWGVLDRDPGCYGVVNRVTPPDASKVNADETMYDYLPVEEAVLRAWGNFGRCDQYHIMMQQVVRDAMPLLGRALDRAAQEKREEQWQTY